MTAFDVRSLAATTSTNDEVKRAIEAGAPEGLVVRARRQTGGYGRQGRVWASPEGGLYLSMLLRPEVPAAQLPTLSLVVSLAVRRALVALADPEAAANILIKWPNDLVVSAAGKPLEEADAAETSADEPRQPAGVQPADGAEHRKICGISLEAHAGGVCVGVGVNVCAPSKRPAVGGKNEPAYLDELAPSLAAVPLDAALDRTCEALLCRFDPLYLAWQRDGFVPLLDEYNAHASLAGRAVRMVDRMGAPIASGVVSQVDASGRLVLRDESGANVPVSSGEAHIV